MCVALCPSWVILSPLGQLNKRTKMKPSSKVEKKAAGDAAAWMFNVVTSVGIIIVNKALMATYGFSFGKYFLPI